MTFTVFFFSPFLEEEMDLFVCLFVLKQLGPKLILELGKGEAGSRESFSSRSAVATVVNSGVARAT